MELMESKIKVTLKKENGSFGMVIRGGDHEVMRKRRPFTVFGITPDGPTASEGTLRCGDRIRAINGISLGALKLPELQSMLYQQDKEAVFTVEYDVMISDNYHTVSLENNYVYLAHISYGHTFVNHCTMYVESGSWDFPAWHG